MTSAILEAMMYLGIGSVVVYALYFMGGVLWILLWPNADQRRAKEMRKASQPPVDFKKYMGI